MKPYILAFSLLATTTSTTYISCHPTIIISADNIRTHDNLEKRIDNEKTEQKKTPPVQKETEKKLY